MKLRIHNNTDRRASGGQNWPKLAKIGQKRPELARKGQISINNSSPPHTPFRIDPALHYAVASHSSKNS